jgi:hypothetical protein
VLTDLYTLAPERSATTVARFLDHFIPNREESAADYAMPQYSRNPSMILTNADDAFQYSVANRSAAQRIYGHRLGQGEPRSAHVFFLADGGLILGLSIEESTEARWQWWLEQLKQFVGSPFGYYVCETPPAESIADFRRLAK